MMSTGYHRSRGEGNRLSPDAGGASHPVWHTGDLPQSATERPCRACGETEGLDTGRCTHPLIWQPPGFSNSPDTHRVKEEKSTGSGSLPQQAETEETRAQGGQAEVPGG